MSENKPDFKKGEKKMNAQERREIHDLAAQILDKERQPTHKRFEAYNILSNKYKSAETFEVGNDAIIKSVEIIHR